MFRKVICLSLILNTLFAYTSAAQTEKEKFLIKNLQEISRNQDSLRAVGDLFIQSEYDEVRFEGLYIKGFLHLIAQQSDSAIYYYTEASKLIDNTSNQVKNRYRIYVKLLAAYNSIGKSKDFQKILDEVEQVAKQNNDSALLSEFFRYKGLKLAKEGRLEEAIANQTKSAELNILLNRPELINNYLIIGNTYIKLNKNKEAISWFIKSNQEAEKRRDFGTQFILKNSLGKTYQRIEKMDSAMYYYNLVLQDTSKLIVKDKIYFFHNLASYYLDVKHKDSANLYINEIEKLLNEQSKKTVTGIEFYKLKSDYYLKFNEYEKALLYADSARN
jgi:tetratricopeptide (TPR) repeat protein